MIKGHTPYHLPFLFVSRDSSHPPLVILNSRWKLVFLEATLERGVLAPPCNPPPCSAFTNRPLAIRSPKTPHLKNLSKQRDCVLLTLLLSPLTAQPLLLHLFLNIEHTCCIPHWRVFNSLPLCSCFRLKELFLTPFPLSPILGEHDHVGT